MFTDTQSIYSQVLCTDENEAAESPRSLFSLMSAQIH